MKNNSTKSNIAKIALIAAVFSVMIFLDVSMAATETNPGVVEFEKKKEELPANSPFLDKTPRIDQEAASVEKETAKENTGEKNYEILLDENRNCRSLPQNFWLLIFAAYLFLIIFNLLYEFEEREDPQWFWESAYTLLALLAWYNFDACRLHSWFPATILETGIIVYSFYLYFLRKRIPKISVSKDEEKTAKLPFE